MIIIEVLNESHKCVVGIIDVCLARPLKYFSSTGSINFCLRMSSALTAWLHCSTCDAWLGMYLGTSAAAALYGTGADCGGQSGRLKSYKITVWYVDDCIFILRRPCFPPPNYDWMVDAFDWFFQWISRIIFSWWPPNIFLIFLIRNLLWVSSALEVIIGFLVSPSSVCLIFFIIVFTKVGVLKFVCNR